LDIVEIFHTVCYCACMSLISGLLWPRLFSSKLSKAKASTVESARNNALLPAYSDHGLYRVLVDFPAFLKHGSVENIRVCAHTNRGSNKQEVGLIFV
jgi:hypothetical protein